MSIESLQYLRKTIRKDPRLMRLDAAFDELPEFSLNANELYEEIKRIHMVRKTRHLDRRSKTFVDDVTEGLLDDQAHRSRLSEILISCVQIIRNLENTLESMEGHLLMEYDDLLREIRTKGERQTFVRTNVLNKYLRYVDRIDRVKQTAEIIITDIDKAAWMYRNIIEAVKLATGHKEAV
jgi:hypothetical protein